MRRTHSLSALACAAWMAATTPIALAGDDHGDAPAASSGPALPRFAAASETFELVGVVNGKRLTLYLDRYADGSPVKDATLELELGGVKVPVESHGEGEFEAMLAQELKPGSLAVSAMVVAGAKAICSPVNLMSMTRGQPTRRRMPMAGVNTPPGQVPLRQLWLHS